MTRLEKPVKTHWRERKSNVQLTYPLIHTPYYYCDNLSRERNLIVIGGVDMWITFTRSLKACFTPYWHVYS
jgi:hypothetical protein